METNFYCEKCEKFFKRNTTLVDHMNNVHKEEIKKFICPLYPACKGPRINGFFNPIGNLKIHYKEQHKGEILDISEVKCALIERKSE